MITTIFVNGLTIIIRLVWNISISDNGSNPPLQAILQDYINEGLVTYVYDERHKPQVSVYNECLKKYRKRTKWIAFFDSDEFLVLKRHSNIRELLSEYRGVGALSICWVMFGSNGHDKKQKSILQSYTKRCPETYDSHYKTIVRPTRVKEFTIHHVERHVYPYCTVNENGERVSGPWPESRRQWYFN